MEVKIFLQLYGLRRHKLGLNITYLIFYFEVARRVTLPDRWQLLEVLLVKIKADLVSLFRIADVYRVLSERLLLHVLAGVVLVAIVGRSSKQFTHITRFIFRSRKSGRVEFHSSVELLCKRLNEVLILAEMPVLRHLDQFWEGLVLRCLLIRRDKHLDLVHEIEV